MAIAFSSTRIAEQAKDFACTPGESLKLGKEATTFTRKLLTEGKPKVLTRGKFGHKAQESPGLGARPQSSHAE